MNTPIDISHILKDFSLGVGSILDFGGHVCRHLQKLVGRDSLPSEVVKSLMKMVYACSMMSSETALPGLKYFVGNSSFLSTRLVSTYNSSVVASLNRFRV